MKKRLRKKLGLKEFSRNHLRIGIELSNSINEEKLEDILYIELEDFFKGLELCLTANRPIDFDDYETVHYFQIWLDPDNRYRQIEEAEIESVLKVVNEKFDVKELTKHLHKIKGRRKSKFIEKFKKDIHVYASKTGIQDITESLNVEYNHD